MSVLVVYDSRSLAVINNTGRAVNLASLVLTQGTITFPVTRWRTQWLSGTLEAFPAQDCVQVYSWFDSNVPRPAGCREARSIVTIDPAEMFWLAGDFEVRQQNTVLATCRRADGRCTVPLPG